MTAPLDGIVVVALEQAVAAPFATRQLADLGATVLKVERPGDGDFARHYDTTMSGSSAFFVWANRGKQSIELDLKDEADRAVFDDLVAGADVFIQNLSPAAAERAGIQGNQLRAANPSLVACDISGYGLGGPRTHAKAYDLAIQAEAAAVMLTGSADQMSKVGFSVADISAAMYAFSSILAALYRKQATGEGATIEVSMLESLAEWTAAPTYAAVGRGAVTPRAAHRHAMIAPYGMYAIAGGGSVMIAVQSNREWIEFCTHVLGDSALGVDERFVNNEDRIAHMDELEAAIDQVFSCLSEDEVVGRLEAGGIAHSWVRDSLSLWDHEQLRARDRFMTVRTPTGEAEVYRSPFNISDETSDGPNNSSGGPSRSELPTDVPVLGSHDPELVSMLRDRAAQRRS